MELEAELLSLDLSTYSSASLTLPPLREVKVPLCYGCGGSKEPWDHSQNWTEQGRGFAPRSSSVVLTVGSSGLLLLVGRGPKAGLHSEPWGTLGLRWAHAPGEPLRFWEGFCRRLGASIILSVQFLHLLNSICCFLLPSSPARF